MPSSENFALPSLRVMYTTAGTGEFCKISKNTFSYKTHPVAASVFRQSLVPLASFFETIFLLWMLSKNIFLKGIFYPFMSPYE